MRDVWLDLEGGQGLGGLVSGVSLHLGSGAEGPEEGRKAADPVLFSLRLLKQYNL